MRPYTMTDLSENMPGLPAGFLLCGGKSSRMGENKAFLEFRGESLLARGLATLQEACGSVAIVGEPSLFAQFGPAIADVFSGCGPLAGIHAALVHSSAELNLVLAVDMPFVSVELLRFLQRRAMGTDAMVTVPNTRKGFQPLCAVYHHEFAAVAERALRAGNYKIDAAFRSTGVRIVEEAELLAAGFSEKDFFNVNTPEDRRAAESEF